ncbi:hypothetical protein [Thiobacillus denitrificans]|uniref:hypothetical protein n=1 Tax=Thiobacillus denitrificans TaxID=36861 RepID=UPI00037EDA21|nr:hypothetical protein [Thiobacillus denitrificans]
MLTLMPEAEGEPAVKMSRTEFAALLVLEEAEMVDELEDPHREMTREVTNLSFSPLLRIVDWHAKIYLLRRMMRWSRSSPKSPRFRAAYVEAERELNEYQLACGLGHCKTWSHWTFYHDMQRWRSSKYAMAAIQRKGVEYCPWATPAPLYEEARKLAHEITLKHPGWTIEKVHEEALKKLEPSYARPKEANRG